MPQIGLLFRYKKTGFNDLNIGAFNFYFFGCMCAMQTLFANIMTNYNIQTTFTNSTII